MPGKQPRLRAEHRTTEVMKSSETVLMEGTCTELVEKGKRGPEGSE